MFISNTFSATVLLVPAKPFWLELLPTEPMLALSELLAVSLFRSMSAKELGWFVNCFSILALQMARSKKACIVFFDEVDAIGGARFDDGVGGDNEVQRTMLEIVNQLDGFDARGNIKVLMATNSYTVRLIGYFCSDTLDPALLRPGRLDRKVEFGLPDLESRTQIFKIHTRTMNCERDIRFELLARLCPNSTAGMYAIRARRKTVTEKDFLDAVNKVIKGYQKFSATPNTFFSSSNSVVFYNNVRYFLIP
ncbi:hypothetical protein YC2023_065480 [Brassica napus]